jgi:2-methylcitrate dehydratase PrpD
VTANPPHPRTDGGAGSADPNLQPAASVVESAVAGRRAAGGLTLALADRASSLRFDHLPADVVEVSRHALLDWFGVTLGGSREDATTILLETLPARASGGRGWVSIVGHDLRLWAPHAALVNGTSSHRLDFDDVNAHFLGHVTVAVGGALLALAEKLDASGSELITAYVAGYEMACRIASAIGPQPYIRGFHSTGTVGTLGAAAACARLMGLDAPQTTIALGLAASQAAGIKRNIGTMTKSFHAGKACENGLLAALLAARGFTASADAIEGDQGFAAVSGADCDADAALADPPSCWYVRDNLFKYHASCYWTHSMVEGMRELIASNQLAAGAVERVVIHVSELELGTCAIPAPTDALEVKFSLTHLAAMALLGRDLSVITDADAHDADVIALRRKMSLVEDGAAGQPTRVEVTTGDGLTVHAAIDVNAPQRDLSAQYDRLSRKFERLAEPVIGAAASAELRQLLTTLDDGVGVRRLMSLACRAPTSPD